MDCLPISSVRRGIAFRLALCGVALTALQGCATTGEKASVEKVAAPAAQTTGSPAKAVAARKPEPADAGYSDPAVVSMAPGDAAARPSYAVSSASANPANLGDVVMQPAAINAGRSSIFAQQAEPVPAEAGASTMTAASLVPAEMPTRRVNPMTGSLFSAPQYASVEPADMPADAQAAGLPPEEAPLADAASLPSASEPEEEASTDPATPMAEEAPAEPAKKKTLLPILGRLLGKSKS